MKVTRFLISAAAAVAAFAGLCAFSAHWGMGPSDLDDLGFDWNRGEHVQQVRCSTMTYRIYRGNERFADRIVFTLREPGDYEIFISFGDASEPNVAPPKILHTSVEGFHWLPPKVDVVQRLPEHVWITVSREPKDHSKSGAWSCGGGAL